MVTGAGRGLGHHMAVALAQAGADLTLASRTREALERTADEISRMREMLPGTPIVGFYSFGEQGLADDGVNRHNNGVVAVLALGRKLSPAAEMALLNERMVADLQVQIAERTRAETAYDETLRLAAATNRGIIMRRLLRVTGIVARSVQ